MEFTHQLAAVASRIDEIRQNNERRITALSSHPYEPIPGESLGQLAQEQYDLLKFLREHEEFVDSFQFREKLRKGQFLYEEFYPEQELGSYERGVGALRHLLSQVECKRVNRTVEWAANRRLMETVVFEATNLFPEVANWQPRVEEEVPHEEWDNFGAVIKCSYRGDSIELKKFQDMGEFVPRTWLLSARRPDGSGWYFHNTVTVPEGASGEEANILLIRTVDHLLNQRQVALQEYQEQKAAREEKEEAQRRINRFLDWVIPIAVIIALAVVIALLIIF